MQTNNMLYLVSEYAPYGEIFGLYISLEFFALTFMSFSAFMKLQQTRKKLLP